MATLEATRTDLNCGEPYKASVVKSGAGYRAEQGSDYEPGVSAETVGSKTLWLGMISLPAGKRTRAHVHEYHETALYMVSGDQRNCGRATNFNIATSCSQATTSSFRQTCRTLR